jgi:hypothetical protein
MSDNSCDECAGVPENGYIRVQVWGEGLARYERVFCSVTCMRKYIKDWTDANTLLDTDDIGG